jgi:hypothetical protein
MKPLSSCSLSAIASLFHCNFATEVHKEKQVKVGDQISLKDDSHFLILVES